jgi:hypothetical protein
MKDLKAGQSYHAEIRLSNVEFFVMGSPFSSRGGIRLGGIRAIGDKEAIHEAVQLAKESDGLCDFFLFTACYLGILSCGPCCWTKS